MGVYEALTGNPQAALDQAGLEPGSMVVFTPGLHYLIPTNLIIRSKTHLRAYGARISCVDSNHMLLRAFDETDSFAGYDGPSDITIEGGVWDARAWDEPSPLATNGFNFCHGRNIKVRNLSILNVNGAHAVEFAAIDGGRIENCRFEGFYDPGDRDFSEAIQLDWPDNSASTTIGLWDGTPCKNITVDKCYMGPSLELSGFGTLIGSHGVVPTSPHRRIKVVRCEVDGGTQFGIRTWSWNEVILSNNQVDGTTGSSVLVQHSNDVVVANNTVTNAGRNAFNISGSSRVVVDGNIVRNTVDQYGIWMGKVDNEGDGTTDSLITNNLISGADIAAIRMSSGTNRCVVVDNMLRRDGGGQIGVSADAGSGTVNKVTRNYLHGFATPLQKTSGTIEET